MDLSRNRRKALTYGKANKRLPLPDIFDVSPEPSRQRNTSTSTRTGSEPQSVAKGQAAVPSDPNTQLAQQLNRSTEATTRPTLSMDRSPCNSDLSSLELHNEPRIHSTASSLFDITSSDDESAHEGVHRSTRKRRKLLSAVVAVDHDHTTKTTIPSKPKPMLPQAFSTQQSHKHAVDRKPSRSPTGEQTNKAAAGSRFRTFGRTKPVSRRITDCPTVNCTQSLSSVKTWQSSGRSGPSSAVPSPLESDTSILSSAEESARSSDTASHVRSTPKRKGGRRNAGLRQDVAQSPSQLGLKSLRLTPEERAEPFGDSVDTSDLYAFKLTPRRVRQRLVDRLDTPRKHGSSHSSRAQSVTSAAEEVSGTALSDCGKTVEGIHDSTSTGLLMRESQADNISSAVQIPQQGLLRHKITYARDRSHLNDMVLDDVEVHSSPMELTVASQPLSQNMPFVGVSPQLELESSDSDEQASAIVKSIHELRQAGANNRFEKELDTLFEDIEGKNGSSKALRLQGLMQLIRKMSDEAFVRRVIDAGVGVRLTTLAGVELDLLSATFTVFAFSILAGFDGTGVTLLKQMLLAEATLAPILIQESRSLGKIAKDRTKNVARSLVREIQEFEEHVLSHAVWGDEKPTSPSPQIISLYAEALTRQRLRNLKEPEQLISHRAFTELISLLDSCSRSIRGDGEHEELYTTIKTVISILDCSDLSGLFPGLASPTGTCNLLLLCEALSAILGSPSSKSVALGQAALRVVITFTNDPGIAATLASSHVMIEAFGVVERNFLALAVCADQGDKLDKEALDSVILALGALLNMAGGSREAQQTMLRQRNRKGSPADWLVATFNDRVDLALEVTTLDQSQVSIAFGHLAMLLCTLCLDDDTRPYITSRLHGQSLRHLCLAGDLFLVPWKKIEAINPDDAATKAFTERFSCILTTIKKYA